MVAPMKKPREYFVLQPVMEKNLSRVSKLVFVFPKSFLEKAWSKLEKWWF
jgi:hypothetical protein